MKYKQFYEPNKKRYTENQVNMALAEIRKNSNAFIFVSGTNYEKICTICKVATKLNNPFIVFPIKCGIENITLMSEK